MNLKELLKKNPVIPGIKDDHGLEAVLKSPADIVFILYGDIVSITDITSRIKASGKMVFVNVDLLGGSAVSEVIIHFLKKHTDADGIMSSKAGILKAAKKAGFYTIHRLFIIDSFSFGSISKQISISRPDCLEILPGWPKLVTWTLEKIDMPVISGGMICQDEDVQASLQAGAISISSTNEAMWPV